MGRLSKEAAGGGRRGPLGAVSSSRRGSGGELGNKSTETKLAMRGELAGRGSPHTNVSPEMARQAKGRVQHETRMKKMHHHTLQETFRKSLELKDRLKNLAATRQKVSEKHEAYLSRNLLYVH